MRRVVKFESYVGVLLMLTAFAANGARLPAQVGSADAEGAISVRSNLVVVPTFVKTKRGENVFSLEAQDFELTDDGIPQKIRLEPEADAQSLALVVLVQTGGQGAFHLNDYSDLGTVLDAVVGAVPHRIAVVSFDSQPSLNQNFEQDTDKTARSISALEAGDQGASILDGLSFATSQLAAQPAKYRRAILLLSETADSGSKTSLDAALQAIDGTNTAIYSFAFSSTRAASWHEGAKLPNPFSPTKYSKTPYKAGGRMSREVGADPDANGSRAKQALDCADDLLPPLRLARMAYLAAVEGVRRNVPETVSRLTGGEYFSFKDGKGLRQQLIAISKDVHVQYVLTFQPTAPHVGLHTLAVTLRDRGNLVVKARDAYWIDLSKTTP